MIARLGVNLDLGDYAFAVGSAQRLSNGNYFFDSGILGEFPNVYAVLSEFAPDGSLTYSLQVDALLYRSFRMGTLYDSPEPVYSLTTLPLE
jgi:hypothetical protein